MGGKFYEHLYSHARKVLHHLNANEIRRMNYDFHYKQNYQKTTEFQLVNNMFFKTKKTVNQIQDESKKDLELVTRMNQELARSLI